MSRRENLTVPGWIRDYDRSPPEAARGILQAVLNIGKDHPFHGKYGGQRHLIVDRLLIIGDEVNISEPIESLRQEAREVLIRFVVPNEKEMFLVSQFLLKKLIKFWARHERHSHYGRKNYQEKVKAVCQSMMSQHKSYKKETDQKPIWTSVEEEVEFMRALVNADQFALLMVARVFCLKALPFLYHRLSESTWSSFCGKFSSSKCVIEKWHLELLIDYSSSLFDEDEIKSLLLEYDSGRAFFLPAYKQMITLCDWANSYDRPNRSMVSSGKEPLVACIFALLGTIVASA
ncbi:hypothetical protein HQ571_02520 [Candidatus Kuenenbacteria bacterium]|nr:hypothetical protein [Candidatus Kuenenbacteria bacterium]